MTAISISSWGSTTSGGDRPFFFGIWSWRIGAAGAS